MSQTVVNITPSGVTPGTTDPCGPEYLQNHLGVLESDSTAGWGAAAPGFAPFTGERYRFGDGIVNTTLRSAHNAVVNRGEKKLTVNTGVDIAMTGRNCAATNEWVNYGARSGNTSDQLANDVFNTGLAVIRVWKDGQYLQYDNSGELVFANSSTFEDQGFQQWLTAEGNLGLNKPPEHRLDLGANPCDKEGKKCKAYGAQLGFYVLIRDCKCPKKYGKLTVKNGKLRFNGKKVLTEGCRPRRDSCGCDSSSSD